MKIGTLAAMVYLASTSFAFAQSEVRIKTRFGDLTTNKFDELVWRGKVLKPTISVISMAYFVKSFTFSTHTDLVLIQTGQSQSCSGKYVWLMVQNKPLVKITPEFGTCYDEALEFEELPWGVSFWMTNLGGKGKTQYLVTTLGDLKENGRPVANQKPNQKER